jgi:hypothetical protein
MSLNTTSNHHAPSASIHLPRAAESEAGNPENLATGPTFQFCAADVESVLHDYTLRIINSRGLTIAPLAVELFAEIDAERVLGAAEESVGTDIAQINAAYAEIKTILVELGVLEF